MLRVTLSSIADGLITTDRLGNVTFLNAVAESLTGWSLAQATGRALADVFNIVNHDTRAQVENPALKALREGVPVGLASDTILIAKDGRERTIDDSAAPIRDGPGDAGVAGSVLIFRDITERSKQARLVYQGRAYAENILHTLPHPYLILDKDLRVVSANRSFYETFGVTPDDTEGELVHELGNGQWNIRTLRAQLEDILPKDGHTIEDYEVDYDFPGELGRRVMSLNARRISAPDNQSRLILLVIEDVTKRRRAADALEDSEDRYHRLFQTAKDGVLILDGHTGKIIDANAFMTTLVGLETKDLLGKELFEIGMFADEAESKAAFKVLQEKRYLRYEHLPLQNQRGEKVEVEVVANIYHEAHLLVAQCNVRDISQRVALEKKIATQAEQLADESRRKDEFLAMLSHELRDPLAPIRAAVHLLRTQELPGGESPIQKQAHDIIERQVGNLSTLVGDLLEVSSVASGRIRLRPQVLDLCQIVQNAVETTRPLFEVRKHTLKVELCGTDPQDESIWVNADAARMEEVFVNILSNAAKFTPNGGEIEVRCDYTNGANHARVHVRDNGTGIDPTFLPHIFDLFSQADHSLARAAGGLGIGLSLAHRLIEMHGGTITAISPPADSETGSEFIVTLPVTMPPDRPFTIEADAPPAQAEGTRVLLVDDNIDLGIMLASILRQKGYAVQIAYTGPEALKWARRWHPDVVLLDIGLPGLDGYEVARRLRSDPTPGSAGQPMRIIAMTGYGSDGDRALAREAGFNGHLVKPVAFHDLERMMRGPFSWVTQTDEKG